MFEYVLHRYLIYILQNYGIKGEILIWIENYLTNRTQKVFIECHSSWIGSTHVGVPQGSLLGPFLFHILNNDISDINLKSNQIRLFADHIYVLVVVVDNTRNAAKSLTADPEIVKNVLE